MKILVLAAILASTLTAAADNITVHLCDYGNVPPIERGAAMATTAGIYREIGINVEWKFGRPCGDSSSGAIVVDFREFTPLTFMPGALAYAHPFGNRVVVLWDRVKKRSPAARVLGHVMAHEICHVLQGLVRHAESGLMKASWTVVDYSLMHYKPLEFTPSDIELIRKGIARFVRPVSKPDAGGR